MNTNFRNTYYMACIVCASEGAVMASVTNNIVIGPRYTNAPPAEFFTLAMTPPANLKLTDVFVNEFDKRITVATYDAFGPHSTLGWIYQFDRGDNLNVAYVNSGKNAMQHALVNSLRETVAQSSVFGDAKTLVEQILIGSIGRTSEQSIKTTGLTPVAAQETWQAEMLASKGLTYGFHNLDGTGYIESRFGHQSDGKPVGTVLARLHYDPIMLRSSVDEQLSFFLPWSSMLTFGSSYQLINLRSHKDGLNCSATWSRPIGTNWWQGVFVTGLTFDDHNNMLAQVSVNWSN